MFSIIGIWSAPFLFICLFLFHFLTGPNGLPGQDLDVAYFKLRPSTTENLATFIWEEVKNGLEESGAGIDGTGIRFRCELHEVEIEETAANCVRYKGERV